MIQMEDDEDSDFELPVCERFQTLINKPSIPGLLQCTVCSIDCLAVCDFSFVETVLVPGIIKLLSASEGSIVESMLNSVPDFCEVLFEQFPEKAEDLAVTVFVPETSKAIEKAGDLITDTCAESFAALITLLNIGDFIKCALPILDKFSHMKKKEMRIIVAKVLAFIPDYFSCDAWFDVLYQLITTLSSDNLGGVRSLVPSIIALYSKIVTDDEKKTLLTSRYQLFCIDKSILVRKAAAESLVNLSNNLNNETKAIIIIPATKSLLNDNAEAVRSVITKNLGPLISTFGENVDSSYVQKYTQALNSPDPALAYASAFSFPAVALTLGKKRWNELKDAFEIAILSHEFRVRKTLAYGLLSYGFIMEPSELSDVACGFLRDLPNIADGIIKHLYQILPSVENQDSFLFSLMDPSSKYREWRIRWHVSEQLRYCMDTFDNAALYQSAKELIQDEVAVVRNDAAISFGVLMKEENIIDLKHLAKNPDHHIRIAAANVFNNVDSNIAFKAVSILKTLCEDPVPNVRVAAVKSAYNLNNRENIPLLTQILNNAKKDEDLDVQRALSGD